MELRTEKNTSKVFGSFGVLGPFALSLDKDIYRTVMLVTESFGVWGHFKLKLRGTI